MAGAKVHLCSDNYDYHHDYHHHDHHHHLHHHHHRLRISTTNANGSLGKTAMSHNAFRKTFLGRTKPS